MNDFLNNYEKKLNFNNKKVLFIIDSQMVPCYNYIIVVLYLISQIHSEWTDIYFLRGDTYYDYK